MSNYSKSYDGAAKDAALSSIDGADFDTEFELIETAIATKADKSATADRAAQYSSSNVLEASVVTSTELGYVSGVTSAVQTQLDAKADTLGFKGALVSASLDQTITSGANTALVWDTEGYDTSSIHDNVTNNTRLTVPSGITKVKLKASVTFAGDTTGTRKIYIWKNSLSTHYVGKGYSTEDSPVSTGTYLHTSTSVLEVIAGDYFEAFVAQTSGGDLDAIAANVTWFAMEIIE